MQFTPIKTLLALIFVYGIYVGVYLMSPAPLYATKISSLLFLIFGTIVWYIGFQFGTNRTNHRNTGNESQAGHSQPESGMSK